MTFGIWKPRAITRVLLISASIAMFVEGSSAQTSSAEMPSAISTTTVPVLHRSITFQSDFGRFTQSLERILGHYPPDVQQDILERPKVAEQRIKAAEGAQELMIFFVLDHGAALNMVGSRRNAKQYLIGNALTAIQMTQHDIRAALYAPLRVLVYEQKEGRTTVEYDQPSSLFGQFGREDIRSVALTLDVKLGRALGQAAELSHQ